MISFLLALLRLPGDGLPQSSYDQVLCLCLANLLFLVVGLGCLRTLQYKKIEFFCFSLLATRAYLTLQFKPKPHLLHLPLTVVVELLGILHLASYLSISTLKLFFAFLLGLLVSIFFKKVQT